MADALGARKMKFVLPVPKGNALKLDKSEYITETEAITVCDKINEAKIKFGWKTVYTFSIWNKKTDGYSILVYPNGKTYAWPALEYEDKVDVKLVEIPMMYLLSIRKNVLEHEFSKEYGTCFGKLFRKMEEKKLTAAAPPMVLFHDDEYTPFGLDTEFAIPIREYATGTRDFCPGLCLKTVVQGSYSQLPSVYAKQIEWAKREGYENSNALYEVYVTDPAEVSKESELVTEVYYPVKKKGSKDRN